MSDPVLVTTSEDVHYRAEGVPEPVMDVPTTSVDARLFGTAAGPLLTAAGSGVRGGVPYGEQLATEQQEMIDQYRFRPGARDRLAAATRKALGR